MGRPEDMTQWESLAAMDDADLTEWEVEQRINRLKGLGSPGLAAMSRLQKRIQDALIEDREDMVG